MANDAPSVSQPVGFIDALDTAWDSFNLQRKTGSQASLGSFHRASRPSSTYSRGTSFDQSSFSRNFQDNQSFSAQMSRVAKGAELTSLRSICNFCVEPQQLEKLEELGCGDTCTVDLCQTVGLQHNQQVVVKYLKRDMLQSKEELLEFVEQARNLRTLRHRNLTKLLGIGSASETDVASLLKSVYLVEEYLDGNSLFDLVMEQMRQPTKRVYPSVNALWYLQQVASALQYLHTSSPKVIHNDLKLTNIMMHVGAADRAREAMVTDYGFSVLSEKHHHDLDSQERKEAFHAVAEGRPCNDAKLLQINKNLEHALNYDRRTSLDGNSPLAPHTPKTAQMEAGRVPGYQGSFVYTAPEVTNDLPCDEKVDVFAFGTMMYELFTRQSITAMICGLDGKPTADSVLALELYSYKVAAGHRLDIPASWPVPLRQLVSDCWEQDPALRPTMAQICDSLSDYELVTTIKGLDKDILRVASSCHFENHHHDHKAKQGCGCSIM